ncbi:hypothetical protein EUX98_g9391 [Antrodiella citrinella]|uniref:Uncharacterized protein n=1 Tax=Antrodiella citrinella TaxID=2447956 RepID=A0A4S4LUD2_9APHY|nr:hypothetical protein EUX98_g9391 [Antrodiella citrinella]
MPKDKKPSTGTGRGRPKKTLTAEEQAEKHEMKKAKDRERSQKAREKKKADREAEQAQKIMGIATMEVDRRRQVTEKIAAALGPPKRALSTGRRTTRQRKEVKADKADSPDEEAGEQSSTDVDVDNDDQQIDGMRTGQLTRQGAMANVMDTPHQSTGPTRPHTRPQSYDSCEESGEQLTDNDGGKAGELATIPPSVAESTPKHRVLIDLSSTVKPATRMASRAQKRKSLSPKMKRMPPSALKSILKKPGSKCTYQQNTDIDMLRHSSIIST